jgi:Mn2+/Fe2+ NRAMP family transporter
MFHLHLIGRLTLEVIALIAAFFLLIYVNKHQLKNWYRKFSKAIFIIVNIIILVTFIHAIVHHFHQGHSEMFPHHKTIMHKHHEGGHH